MSVQLPNEELDMENDKIEPEQEKTDGLDFGDAIRFMKDGKRVSRAGWNGKGMFVYLVPPASYPVQTGAAKEFFGEGSLVPAYMAIKNVDDTVSTWTPSINDCHAEDWLVVNPTVNSGNSAKTNVEVS